jgi:hypothetical protein
MILISEAAIRLRLSNIFLQLKEGKEELDIRGRMHAL